MEQPTRFCEYCGKPLNAKARFCGKCGKPVELGEEQPASPPAQVAPPPVPPGPPRPGQPLQPVQRAQPPGQALVQRPAQQPPAPAARPDQSPPAPPRPAQPPPPPVQYQGQPPPARPGQPLPAPLLPNQAAAPPEMVCGVIPGAIQRKGMLGLSQQAFTLVLTNYRVIFAMQTNQMMQEQVRYAREAAKQAGKGFFGQWGAQLSASSKYYLQKPPEAILAEQPGNFFIPHNQLRAVKFHVVHGGDESPDEYRMEFDAVSGKVGVVFTMIDQNKAKQALTQVLGDNKVHWSHGFFG